MQIRRGVLWLFHQRYVDISICCNIYNFIIGLILRNYVGWILTRLLHLTLTPFRKLHSYSSGHILAHGWYSNTNKRMHIWTVWMIQAARWWKHNLQFIEISKGLTLKMAWDCNCLTTPFYFLSPLQAIDTKNCCFSFFSIGWLNKD